MIFFMGRDRLGFFFWHLETEEITFSHYLHFDSLNIFKLLFANLKGCC